MTLAMLSPTVTTSHMGIQMHAMMIHIARYCVGSGPGPMEGRELGSLGGIRRFSGMAELFWTFRVSLFLLNVPCSWGGETIDGMN